MLARKMLRSQWASGTDSVPFSIVGLVVGCGDVPAVEAWPACPRLGVTVGYETKSVISVLRRLRRLLILKKTRIFSILRNCDSRLEPTKLMAGRASHQSPFRKAEKDE